MTEIHKEILGSAAVLLTFIAYFPYIRSILQNKTKPHVFSWIIWCMTTVIVFLAQLYDRGGAGAWPLGVSAVISALVAVLAYRQKSDARITRSDWAFFISAILSVPLWYWTSDPFWAVVLLTGIDVLGFGPTIRKTYTHPSETNLAFFVYMAVRNGIAIAALENYSPTTLLFPVVTGAACLILVCVGFLVRSRSQIVLKQSNFPNIGH